MRLIRKLFGKKGPPLSEPSGHAREAKDKLTPQAWLLELLQRHGLPLMAYCPIDQGVLAANARLAELAARKGASAAQLALAWAMQQGGVMAIPKAVREAHLRENFAAAAITLAPEDLAALDAIFPPPRRKTALAMV